MREIKFRAWDKHKKEMWNSEKLSWTGLHLDSDTAQFYSRDTGDCHSWLKPLQYTGLQDKNGKEIYEGDIVLWSTSFDGKKGVAPVIFEEGMLGLKLKEYGNCMLKLTGLNIEVVGDIYKNPELLGGE